MSRLDKKHHIIHLLEGSIEILVLCILYYIAWSRYREFINKGLFMFRGKYVLMGLYGIISYVVFRLCDSFDFGVLKVTDISLAQCLSIIMVNAISYLQLCLIYNGILSVGPILLLTLEDMAVAAVCCTVFSLINKTGSSAADVIFIYGSENAMQLADKLAEREDRFRIRKILGASLGHETILGEISPDDIVIMSDVESDVRNKVVKYCFDRSIATFAVPGMTDVMLRGADSVTIFDTPLIQLRNTGLMPEEVLAKRIMDIVLGIMILIPASFIMALIALFIKLEDGGSVLYSQQRLTLDGRVFNILKFRSMVENAEELTGAVLAEEDDPRLTKTGRVIRRYRLDELPQLINVIKGDMSLVGPRPERPELASEIEREMPEFSFRTKVKAGLTGYAQVYGKYNTTAYDKLKLDLIYIENYSLLLDIKLVLMTPQILFRKESSQGVVRK